MQDDTPPDTRALTVKQPWVWAICHEGKNVENRSKRFPSTVPLPATVLLHAGQGEADLGDQGHDAWALRYEAEFPPVRGALVAAMTITGCHHADECEAVPGDLQTAPGRFCSPWALPDSWHWVIGDVTLLDEPEPHRGSLGLWRPDPELAKALMESVHG